MSVPPADRTGPASPPEALWPLFKVPSALPALHVVRTCTCLTNSLPRSEVFQQALRFDRDFLAWDLDWQCARFSRKDGKHTFFCRGNRGE